MALGRPVELRFRSESARVGARITGKPDTVNGRLLLIPTGRPMTGHTNDVRSVAFGILENRPIAISGSDDGRCVGAGEGSSG